MIFLNDTHAEKWAEAVEQAGALRDDDTVNSYFGASLFIITGIPGLYDRVKHHIYANWIDFKPMLDMGLSSGERVLVALAGNFYNGGFFGDYSPSDIVDTCDSSMTELAAKALWLRKQRIDVNTVYE